MKRLAAVLLYIFAPLCVVAATSRGALAQVGTGANLGTVDLTAVSNPTLAVWIQSGATQTIAAVVDGAANSFPSPVQVTTQWNLHPAQSNSIALVGYFTSPTQAMVSGTNYVPSSWILGRMTTGVATTFTAFTQNAVVAGATTVGTNGGSLLLYSQPISGATKQGTRTDNLDLQLDLTGRRLIPGTYTGTLHIRAVVQ